MKKSTKITITILLFLPLGLTILPAEASVKLAYTNGVPVVAVDHCSKIARKMGANYIEFCNYDFKPLDSESPEYYILLLEDTYFVTTNSKAYTAVLVALDNKKFDNFFRSMLKCFIMDGSFGNWNELGYYELHPIFGPTFVPNKNMLTTCWKNKKNRYYFGGKK